MKKFKLMFAFSALAVVAPAVSPGASAQDYPTRPVRMVVPFGPGTGGFDRTGFWKHSVAVACASEIIAAEEKRLEVLPEEAFLAGLLHGVGRIVLSSVLPRAYDGVSRLAERRGVASASVEREMLGIDHHTAGRRVVSLMMNKRIGGT